MAEHIPLELTRAAQGVLTSEPKDWWVRDLTASYALPGDDKLIWLVDEETDTSAVMMHTADHWECINRPEGLPTISRAIRGHPDPVPSDRVGVNGLAKLLMEWYQEPRGYVCSPEFIQANEEVLDSFEGNETDLNVLRSLCVEPEFSESAGSWKLEYNVLNKDGGIDRWVVVGDSDPFEITSIRLEPVRPADTFYYPDEF